MVFRKLLLVGALSGLAACAADPARLAAVDGEACSGYGFTPGTDGYANCRMRLQMQRADHHDARMRTIIDSVPDTPMRVPGR